MHMIEANLHAPIVLAPRLCGPADLFARHASSGACRKATARQLIWAEGDLCTDVFLIRSGAICFSKVLIDGRRVVTGFAYPGEIIGVGSIDLGSGLHRGNAEAIQCCKLEPMTSAIFKRAMSTDLAFARLVKEQVALELTNSYEHIMVVTKMTASERLAHFLIALSKRNRRLGYSPNSVLIPMRRIDIADYLGLTIETISRTFTTFKNGGLIEMEDPCVVFLIDLEQLTALACGAGAEEGSVAICRKVAA